jgi:ATP-dependent Clp protease protease subunit
MSYLGRQRIIFVGQRITDMAATQIVAQLLALESIDPTAEIRMYINSSGGAPYSINAILDTMEILQCPIATVAMGCCMSQSTLLLAAGTKGRRYAMPSTRIMLHQPQGGAMGSTHEVSITTRELNRTMQVVQAMYVQYTGMTLEKIEEETDRDTFLSPAQAVELGIIDAVLV